MKFDRCYLFYCNPFFLFFLLLQTSVEKCNVSALDNVFRTPLHWAAVLGET